MSSIDPANRSPHASRLRFGRKDHEWEPESEGKAEEDVAYHLARSASSGTQIAEWHEVDPMLHRRGSGALLRSSPDPA